MVLIIHNRWEEGMGARTASFNFGSDQQKLVGDLSGGDVGVHQGTQERR